MKNLLTLFIILFFCTPFNIMAQTNKNLYNEKSYILTDFNNQNDAVFMGRRDSISAPYVVPSIGYYDKSGFFVDASLSYLTKSNENRVDLFLITVGHSFKANKFNGTLSGTKYFFNDKSYSIQSEIEGDVSAILSYDFGFLETSLMTSAYFNKNSSTDFFVGAQIAKSMFVMDNSLEIKPTFNVYAGSQYFYQEYYNFNRLGNRKGNNLGQNQQSTTTVVRIEEVNKFNILNAELSMPIRYYYKTFIFSFVPQWAFPQSNATIIAEDMIMKEDLKNIFYWSVAVSFWFNTK
jgi:hypothetical protein